VLVTLSNHPRDYAWGSLILLAELEGRTPSGSPEAEVWFGDHPGSPATVQDGTGRTLDVYLRETGGEPLPYLLKLLAAGSPLSIQVHPSRAEAVVGFEREEEAGIPRDAPERTYRDANHKPELIVAVSERFRALAGLRPIEQTRALLAALGDGPGPRALRERLAGDDVEAALRDTLGWLLSGEAQTEVDGIIASLHAADPAATPFPAEVSALCDIAAAYPGDPGVVVALLMNLVELRRGEAIFIEAGVLHAYLEGLGVELMAASDNVLRGGLTPKHLDVPELLRIVDTTPGAPPRLEPVDGVFAPGIRDFMLTHRVIEGQSAVALSGPAIAVVTRGEVEVTGAAGQPVRLTPGQAAYADEAEAELLLSGAGEVFVAQPGTP
jgi:mannose-6-phosphate isomerase